MKKVLIGGGKGLVGSRLTDILMDHGYEVWHLSRTSDPDNWIRTIKWDIENKILDPKEIEGVDIIINLAGAHVADKKWTAERKQQIRDSRVNSTMLLRDVIRQLDKKPEKYISASAIGYYGAVTVDKSFTEEDEAGTDFLAKACIDWENSVREIELLEIPTAIARIGLVLADEGGMLAEVEQAVRWGVGAPFGKGNQIMPWIHIDDLCGIFFHLINQKLTGVYNSVSPNPASNKDFTYLLAKVLGKSILMPGIPPFILKIILGERSDLVLKGSRISAEKIQSAGFKFQHQDLEGAFRDLYFLEDQ